MFLVLSTTATIYSCMFELWMDGLILTIVEELFSSAANRLIGEVVQSRRRPLLGVRDTKVIKDGRFG